jgi:hypothetical protein
MNSSISGLITKVSKLEKKSNQYLKTIRELETQSQKIVIEIVAGNLNLAHSLKTIQIKIRLIRQRYAEKVYLLDKLNDKIIQLSKDELFFTIEDIEGFESALNSNKGEELSVDQLNPLFTNLSFLRGLRTQLENIEIYEKCALLQKQIEKLKV